MHIVVMGAGVAGLTAALALAERGHDVDVLEQGPGLGLASCSRYAGGMLAPWCERESAEQIVADLGQEALSYWPRVHPQTVQRGSLVVAPRRDERELDRFARRTSHFRPLSGTELGELEPDLGGRFGRALFFPDEAHLDPRQALQSLASRLQEQGVVIRFGVDARQHLAAADRVIDCRGLAARDHLADLRGVRGEMLILRCPEISLQRPVRLLHPRFPLYIVPRDDGHFMVGATSIESGDRTRVTVRSAVELLNAAYTLHPAFGEAEIVELGADARPAFPDNLPRVRQIGRTLYLNGLYRHGFLLAPVLARVADELVSEGKPNQYLVDEEREVG
ncbi:MAG TPA: glycine oxidase ThiO [Geminicoccus sp.]|jgi:glycine oxidase|uniref:glycine oxidase ThiO n=1 Tax=Geminicoccus sp. TaxID=2024832 RepID=UPI002E380C55|nr:glycine oxidase ThiO [Geminicoccus sp.]HEX2529648.1 glycine oxidase ThiO [Geminicoccus sp.]